MKGTLSVNGPKHTCIPGSAHLQPLHISIYLLTQLTILSMPLGPSEVRTASATALALSMLLERTSFFLAEPFSSSPCLLAGAGMARLEGEEGAHSKARTCAHESAR